MPTKGGGALKRPAPLCLFLLLPKFFELLLKVSYFFLSILFGLQRLSKITFCGPWTYLNIHLYSLLWHSALIFFFMFSSLNCFQSTSSAQASVPAHNKWDVPMLTNDASHRACVTRTELEWLETLVVAQPSTYEFFY